MAASCRKVASCPLSLFLFSFGKGSVCKSTRRHFSVAPGCRANRAEAALKPSRSPWTLVAAACVQRLPVVSAELSPIEERFQRLLLQIELEKSVLSDHELRVLDDADKLRRKQLGEYDSDEEDNDDIVLAQDLEDSWEQKLKSFQPTPRVQPDVDKDLTSVKRCLADPLLLLAEHQVGDEKLWLLPQAEWQEGETLRQTAERALASLPGAGVTATFLGNAPCGMYKYKLPRALRTESHVGNKVFFFKAVVVNDAQPESGEGRLLWLKKNELQQHLKPKYLTAVEQVFINF